jgi:TPP-dependent pyruvate/acetoin dehydrogenase alpha subunit
MIAHADNPKTTDTIFFVMDRAVYLDLLYYMLLTRRLEEQLVGLYKEGKIFGGLYSSLGQESISVGTTIALEKEDVVSPVIRNIATVLIKGYRPKDVFCQYLARANSPTKGKDTTLHFGEIERGTVAPISILGPLIPIMAGVALAARIQNKKRVALTYIGDGGASTGDFHEGMNFAAVQRLPFICVIENNQYAYSTPVSKQSRVPDLAQRATGYGIHSAIVDGNDVVAVYETTRKARDICLKGDGPFLMECKTFRIKGHAEHDDPSKYVPREVFEEWRKKDPIDRYIKFLTDEDILHKQELEQMEHKIQELLAREKKEALEAPLPEPGDAATGVFAE